MFFSTFVTTYVSTQAVRGTSDVSVSTQVKSTNSSTVIYKRIESTVNGEHTVIESSEPGETKLVITGKPILSITITPVPTKIATQTIEITSTSFSKDLIVRIKIAINEILGRIHFFSKKS